MGPIRDVLPNNINTSKKPMMEPGQLTFLATENARVTAKHYLFDGQGNS